MKNETNNHTTELVCILDRSGSMAGFESDTVGGFNATLERQRATEGTVLVSTVLFDNDSEVLHDRVDIRELRPMTEADFTVRGCTALYDAVGGAIRHIRNVHKYARPEDVPAHTVFMIMTDGMENASREFSASRVKAMIEEQKTRGWEFIFLAANIDAISAAETIGIRRERAANVRQSKDGYRRCYEAVSKFVTMSRCEASPLAASDEAWKEALAEDDGV